MFEKLGINFYDLAISLFGEVPVYFEFIYLIIAVLLFLLFIGLMIGAPFIICKMLSNVGRR